MNENITSLSSQQLCNMCIHGNLREQLKEKNMMNSGNNKTKIRIIAEQFQDNNSNNINNINNSNNENQNENEEDSDVDTNTSSSSCSTRDLPSIHSSNRNRPLLSSSIASSTRNDAIKWMIEETSRHVVTVLFFYRGQWCSICRQQLEQWNQLHDRIQSFGGQVFGIASQRKKQALELSRKSKLRFPLVVDEKCTLAKALDVSITLPRSSTWKNLTQMMKKFYGEYSWNTQQLKVDHEDDNDSNYSCGMTQPGVFVISDTHDIIYQWQSRPRLRNYWGTTERPDIDYIWTCIQTWIERRSQLGAPSYMEEQHHKQKQLRNTFERIMKSSTARSYFIEHLEQEFSEDNVAFLDAVESWHQSKKPLTDAQRIRDTFISDHAVKQLNFPLQVKQVIETKLNEAQNDDRKTHESISSSLFDPAVDHVETCLLRDSFSRFILSPLFKAALAYI